ncbi:MAG: phosphate signaling complex protein PhoU [SAR202 cluster bacterium]|nr:phosphate signaling complex protein PhoU [SAR202 cluster bacterium]
MRNSTRAGFDRDLQALQDDLLMMGSMVQKAIFKALDGLKNRDLSISRQVIAEDDLIDRKRFMIEDRCIDLIATQQPLAKDLRAIITVLHISVELERMGDYAEGLAKISLRMGEQPPLKPLIDIPRMAEKATEMLRRALDSLVRQDVALARDVCASDDEVDELYTQVYHELLLYMAQDPKTIERATFLLWAAHDIERIADRATNVAERVIYLVTGKLSELNAGRY